VTSDVLLVTCAEFPDGDEDGPQILEALQRCGVNGEWRAWDDAAAPWSSAPAVLRAAWDYTLRRDEFLAWAESVPQLVNPYDAVLWNSDKVYLHDLELAGVPITPTAVIAPGQQYDVPSEWGEVVVKPSVGAGSRGAGRFDSRSAAVDHVRTLHDVGRTALVQPYLNGVDTAGETALIYVDGFLSHAVRKGPMLPSGTAHGVHSYALFVPETIAVREPSAAEVSVGDAALRYLQARFGPLLYARIDVLPGPEGPVVVEAEITEPSLFLSFADGAVDRFAAAVARRLK
jgi:hypothetical protein